MGDVNHGEVAEVAVGKLLSVNVGLPREIGWSGRTVRTAIWKKAVEGRRMVRRLNVDGDGQGDLLGHGGEQRAVFVYQIESYRYWQRQLGRDDFTFGQFGENFTVDGLADDEVCIGDRYRIGTALFEVTQPRDLLPGGHPHELAADARPLGLPPPPGLLSPRSRWPKDGRCR